MSSFTKKVINAENIDSILSTMPNGLKKITDMIVEEPDLILGITLAMEGHLMSLKLQNIDDVTTQRVSLVWMTVLVVLIKREKKLNANSNPESGLEYTSKSN